MILNYSGTIVARIVHDIPSESYFFSLSSDIVFTKFPQKIFKMGNYKRFYQFYFLNKHISVIYQYISLRFSACIRNVVLQERVSQIFNLGLRSNFMTKIG